ncbi:hypothetical protein POX_c04781 [Penicillium oxalicum]|uniref:hypothetical protein n=1 Tax=Penicillium oxalicum TaxID=69781 RepID=UPI0020B73EA8|nr:hypothetical protein POX_c04781 [Penicillium oxalicum]KAI2791901.1 hypothetical protein POX_c04781 [Penicillium oxalicum]
MSIVSMDYSRGIITWPIFLLFLRKVDQIWNWFKASSDKITDRPETSILYVK